MIPATRNTYCDLPSRATYAYWLKVLRGWVEESTMMPPQMEECLKALTFAGTAHDLLAALRQVRWAAEDEDAIARAEASSTGVAP